MPEFEEENQTNKEDVNYSPRNDPKPRSRRRSGGFKNDYSSTSSNPGIGEIDPNSIVREKATEATPDSQTSERSSSRESSDEPSMGNKSTRSSHKRSKEMPSKATPTPKAEPESKQNKTPLNQETLRVIQELEEKISEKKQLRSTRQVGKRQRGKKPASKGPFAALAGFFRGLFGQKKGSSRGRNSKRSGQGRSKRRYSNKKRR